ncbi:cell-death-related nuclease 7-like [Macrosteles quadrilineatus]|uniref:cell-death-related nuclease 7-like n=1 Tax=Macrosteles quadrilineatus TaxID=74068 RepID=UPI0023E34AA1|nr:cell-death-related nuclease 7-like [Macrosteles quadrilineatus]
MRFCKFATILVFSSLVVLAFSQDEFGCRDERNDVVDWFLVYKYPIRTIHTNEFVREGKGHAYITSNRISNVWTHSGRSIEDENNILGNTLSPLYKEEQRKNLLYFMYNDQTPTHTYQGGGHAKGVMAGDKKGGFWMVHSVPNFVASATTNKYTYPSTELQFGQIFLCLSLKPKNLETAGKLMRINRIQIYEKSIPADLKAKYPELVKTAEENMSAEDCSTQMPRGSPKPTKENFKLPGNLPIRVFAKPPCHTIPKGDFDIYSDFVVPDLKVNMLVQTMPMGETPQGSSCDGTYKLVNVKETRVAGVQIPTEDDNSKWAVSDSQAKPWICIGDINRDPSLKRRGGGAVCVKNKPLWEAYHKIVIERETC